MDLPFRFRKRKAKKKTVVNHYKVLETTAQAGSEKIRQQYLNLIRQYPPETHPEKFREIREAYELLSDPEQRQKYDIFRKYGSKIQREMDRIEDAMFAGRPEKAEASLDRILEMDPRNIVALMAKAEFALMKEKLEDFEDCTEKILRELSTEEEKEMQTYWKINSLIKYEYVEQAREAFNAIDREKAEPEKLLEVQIFLEEAEEKLEAVCRSIQKLLNHYDENSEEPNTRAFYLYLRWNLLAQYVFNPTKERETLLSGFKKLAKKIRKYMKDLTEEENPHLFESVDYFYWELIDSIHDSTEHSAYGEAFCFWQMAKMLKPGEAIPRELQKEIQSEYETEKAVEKMMKDDKIAPPIRMKAYIMSRESLEEPLASELEEVTSALDFAPSPDSPEFIYGISRLKKQHAILYKQNKSVWDDLFQRHSAHMNRDERRFYQRG